MNSDEDKLYVKTIALDTVYYFVVEILFYLKSFSVPKFNFKFQNM